MARVAFVLADDFEDSEFRIPFDAVAGAGHEPTIVGTIAGKTVMGKHHRESATIGVRSADASALRFDALVIPGGYSPDRLRLDPDAVEFVRDMANSGKPVAAVCHGPQLLIEADVLRKRTVTCWPSVRRDVENAGAIWVDRPVVEDRNFITSRKPEDLEAFSSALLRRLDT